MKVSEFKKLLDRIEIDKDGNVFYVEDYIVKSVTDYEIDEEGDLILL